MRYNVLLHDRFTHDDWVRRGRVIRDWVRRDLVKRDLVKRDWVKHACGRSSIIDLMNQFGTFSEEIVNCIDSYL